MLLNIERHKKEITEKNLNYNKKRNTIYREKSSEWVLVTVYRGLYRRTHTGSIQGHLVTGNRYKTYLPVSFWLDFLLFRCLQIKSHYIGLHSNYTFWYNFGISFYLKSCARVIIEWSLSANQTTAIELTDAYRTTRIRRLVELTASGDYVTSLQKTIDLSRLKIKQDLVNRLCIMCPFIFFRWRANHVIYTSF